MLITKDVEIWSPIDGYPDYEISDHGRVRSFKLGGVYYLKFASFPTGHLQVRLSRFKKGTNFLVHRLVLENFTGPCPEGMECCQNDGDPTNNHESNRRWDTHAANMADKVGHGCHRNMRHRNRLTDKQAAYVLKNPKGLSQNALVDELRVCTDTIRRIKQGKSSHNIAETIQ